MGQISPIIGMRLWEETKFHDDGVMEKGGETCGIVGKMGTGKSTLLLQLAEHCRYLPKGSKKKLVAGLMSKTIDLTTVDTRPETVVWRGRINDYWNCLIPKNWDRSFPKYMFNPKPLYVFMHEEDDLVFYHADYEGKVRSIPNPPEIITYKNCSDVINKIKEGAINVIYEPQTYALNEFLIRKLKSRMLEKTTFEETGVEKKFSDPCPPLFWIEFFGRVIRNKPVGYMTVIIDEFHQVALARPVGNMWHLIDIFASNFVDLRRNNITVLFATHQTSFIDFRISDRLAKWIWLPGSKLNPSISMVYNSTVARLPLGEAIIEERLSEFGKFKFSRIPKQPPLLRVEGMIE